jgi:hypothetical protein
MTQASLVLDQDQNLINLARTARRLTVGQNSNRQCWGGTKRSLIVSRIIHRDLWYPLGGRARDAIRLEQFGFVNVTAPGELYAGLRNICLLPRGSVLLFRGEGPTLRYNPNLRKSEPICGSISCGHATIKIGGMGSGAEGSDYFSETLITGGCGRDGRGYHFVAAYLPREIYQRARQNFTSNLTEVDPQEVE